MIQVNYQIEIQSLELENYRLFSTLKPVKFDPTLTVFIGENGSGKTAILDAASDLLKFLLKQTFYKKSNGENILNKDIKQGTSSANGTLETIIYNEKYKDEEEERLPIRFDLNPAQPKTRFSVLEESALKAFQEEIKTPSDEMNLPLLIYYGASKNNVDSNNSKKKLLSRRDKVYENALSPKTFSFHQFVKWFDQLHKIRNQNAYEEKYKKSENTAYIIDRIDRVIKGFLNNEDKEKYRDLRMQYDSDKNDVVIDIIDEENKVETVTISQMSSGERSIIALLGDIARRMYIANQNRDDFLQGNGVVLIDEIDIHLHPKWQRKIVPYLTTTFPNVQFVMTTHSPLVLQNVKQDTSKVFRLENGQVMEDEFYHFGRSVDDILIDIYQLNGRRPMVQDKIDNLFKLIDEEKYTEAKNAIEEMAGEGLTENDSELIHANTLIDFLED